MADYILRKWISVYYYKGVFYTVPLVIMPSIGLHEEVLPVFTSPDNNLEKLAESIESAYLSSDVRLPMNQENSKRKGWDGEKRKFTNTAEKCWSVRWNEDGSMKMNSATPGQKLRNGMQWNPVPGSEKTFPVPVSSHEIAIEILNQLKIRTVE